MRVVGFDQSAWWCLEVANHRRPNLKITKGVGVNSNLGFGRLSGSSYGSTASKTRNVLLFLLSGFQDLCRDKLSVIKRVEGGRRSGTDLE